MKSVTLAWWFTTPKPLMLTKALKRLGPKWMMRDSISGRLTKYAWARIFEIGLRGFKGNLTVEVEHDGDLEAMVAEAKKKLFCEVLPLLDAREIEETLPEET